MDAKTSHMLNELNKRFYEDNAESFSRTRENPWNGWERLAPFVRDARSVLDVACGNMRFERYVEGLGLPVLPEFHCVDACPALAADDPRVSFQCLDIVGICLAGEDVAESIETPPYDLVVSFGFFHHVPGADARRVILEALVRKALPGGYVALSFWQFMKDERLAVKAVESTKMHLGRLGISLDAGDCLLGWQDVDGACRYCHSFTDAEIDALLAPIADSVQVEMRFLADGKAVPLNSYVVMRKR